MIFNRKNIFLIMIIFFISAASAFGEKKVALVVGNQNYKNSPLNNPKADAQAMVEKLKAMDFSIIECYDVDRATFLRQLRVFFNQLDKTDIALFYYSGHGVENKNTNYLIPVNEDIKSEDDLLVSAISLDFILDETAEHDCSKFVVILDACRNNPIKKSRGSSKGLVPVTPNATLENFIMYATAAGQTADDGSSNHSPFTAALLNHIDEDSTIQIIAQKVAKEVYAVTNQMQDPYTAGNLKSDLYLNSKGKKNDSYYSNADISFDDSGNLEIDTDGKNDKKNLLTGLFIVLIILLILVLIAFVFFIISGKKSTGVKVEKSSSENNEGAQENTAAVEESSAQNKDSADEEKSEADLKISAQNTDSAEEKKSEELSENNFETEVHEENSEKIFEIPQVLIDDKFYIMKTPVTLEEYKEFFANPSEYKNNNFPVTRVSFKDSVIFCNALSRSHNLEEVYSFEGDHIFIDEKKNGWRLPFEDEWKKAYGKELDFSVLDDYALYSENCDGLEKCESKSPNENGLYDMAGLVREWCNDSCEGKWRLLKGGAWDSDKYMLSKDYKDRAIENYKSDNVGFRMVRNK